MLAYRSSADNHMITLITTMIEDILCLQCFDAVGWVAGRAPGL